MKRFILLSLIISLFSGCASSRSFYISGYNDIGQPFVVQNGGRLMQAQDLPKSDEDTPESFQIPKNSDVCRTMRADFHDINDYTVWNENFGKWYRLPAGTKFVSCYDLPNNRYVNSLVFDSRYYVSAKVIGNACTSKFPGHCD